jgi:hypothetical protein
MPRSGDRRLRSRRSLVTGEGKKRSLVAFQRARTDFSRDLARVLSRGNSADKIFDPSAFQLPEAREEETLTAEQEKQRRMRGSMVKGAPARQQYGERLGAQTRLWAGIPSPPPWSLCCKSESSPFPHPVVCPLRLNHKTVSVTCLAAPSGQEIQREEMGWTVRSDHRRDGGVRGSNNN